ncbi:MAG TPA: YggT family protein [Blastocatellia bacterium]|nr:YggT family protein [Blastocatellia bacterium]
MIWFSQFIALVRWGVILLVAGVIALTLLRVIVQWIGLNPFGWLPFTLRRVTEPFLGPLRKNPLVWQSRVDIAPLLLIILLIIAAAFGLQLLADFHEFVMGMARSVTLALRGAVIPALRMFVGHALLGVISLLMACVIVHVIFSWLGVYGTRLSRFVRRMSGPLLELLHKHVPPVGVFDFTPVIAYFLLMIAAWFVRQVFLG